MLTMQDELLASLLLDDRLRRSEIRRLSQVLPRSPGRVALLVAAGGRFLVATGTRLEAIACRPRPDSTWSLNADLCPDCGN